MLDDPRSDHDAGRLEEAILAALERRERGEELDLRDWLRDDPEVRAALAELLEDERALEPWFGPLRTVAEAAGVGRFIDDYELLEVVAIGGQGLVYKARQVHTNKEVALKVVNPRNRRRSLREVQIAAHLEHERLVGVSHVGEHEGRLYFTMKLAKKGSLQDHLDEYRLPTERATTGAA